MLYTRIYTGTLEKGTKVYVPRTDSFERVAKIYEIHANHRTEIDSIGPGEICAISGLKEITTGDTICDINRKVCLESITFPKPVIDIVIEPKTNKELDKLGIALNKLAEEDPTFKVKYNEETSQTILSGMGELHLEIIVDRLKREFGVECIKGQPKVSYREAITNKIEHREVFKKQSGGRGKFADISVIIEPADKDVIGLQFINAIKGGVIPKEYIPSVEKGFKLAMHNGVLAEFPMDSLKVTLVDGSYHDVDSDSLSFEICAQICFKTALRKAKVVLLEPVMSDEVTTPEEYMGAVIGDLNKRRAKILDIEDAFGVKVVKATTPLAEKFGYVTELRTLTSGRASSTSTFYNYQEVPSSIQEKILEDLNKTS